MPLRIPLLDYLLCQAKSPPLSDLHTLEPLERARLIRAIRALPAEACSLEEWNDALLYLGEGAREDTAQGARRRLLRLLSGSGPDQ